MVKLTKVCCKSQVEHQRPAQSVSDTLTRADEHNYDGFVCHVDCLGIPPRIIIFASIRIEDFATSLGQRCVFIVIGGFSGIFAGSGDIVARYGIFSLICD